MLPFTYCHDAGSTTVREGASILDDEGGELSSAAGSTDGRYAQQTYRDISARPEKTWAEDMRRRPWTTIYTNTKSWDSGMSGWSAPHFFGFICGRLVSACSLAVLKSAISASRTGKIQNSPNVNRL